MSALLRTSLLLASAATLVAQSPTVVEGAVKVAEMTNRDALPPVSPPMESTTLGKTAPAGVTAPAGLTDASFGTLKVAGKNVAIAVGKGAATAERPDTLWLDTDADGKWSDAEKIALEVSEVQARGQGPAGERGKPVDCTFTVGGAQLKAKATYMRQGAGDPMLNVAFPAYLEGKVKVGDEERLVAVIDKDLDGTFGSKGDLWTLAKAGERPASALAMSQVGEKRFTGGQLVGITVEKNNAIKVAAAPATGPDAKDAAAHRERVEHDWFQRFEKGLAQFNEQQKVDTKRPRATKPIDWKYVSFDEAIALGKQANKPVFVDVMAFWCVWCYRMDFHTYVDQEVAELLNTQFIPCKIIQEQDYSGDYDKVMKGKLEATGIPAMGIFDGNGNVVLKINGWKPANDREEGRNEEAKKGFVTKLREGLETFKTGTAGK
jgi:hypothetical protein